MRSRWFHKPRLHTETSNTQKNAVWLELLYDLVFVASFVQLSRAFATNRSPVQLILFAVVFSALWFSWTGFTLFSNRFDVDDFFHRAMVFVQLIAISAMAAFASRILENDAMYFAISYAVAQFIVALMYLRSYVQSSEGRRFSRYWGIVFFSGSLLWMASAFVDQPWNYAFWFFGALLYIVAPFSNESRASIEDTPGDQEHMAKRYGFLTIIVLGEVFLQIMSNMLSNEGDLILLQRAAFTLLIAFCIWWIYFDDVVTSELKNKKFFFTYWLYAHLPFHGAIVAVGIALNEAMSAKFDQIASPSARWSLTVALAIAFISVGILDGVTERKHALLNERVRIGARVVCAAILLVLAPIGQNLSTGMFLWLVAGVCAIQVLFDMMMAPVEAVEYTLLPQDYLLRKRHGEAVTPPTVFKPQPGSLAEAIRKNTPSEYRNDLYSYFIQGSWPKFLISIAVVYFLINLFFAGLYLLEPGSVSNMRPGSFADAFYFSVQTFATIGYGFLSPTTDYSNVIVVIEAAIGIAGVALITGLMFTKASKPKPGILFSKKITVTTMNGKPHLIFRAGNTRVNDVVSAEIMVTVLREELLKEGQRVRRMYDLNLVRSKSPFFGMTWMIMHEIDEKSPFFGVRNSEEVAQRIQSMTCVLTAHDSTYGQTVFARHVYYPDSFFVGRRLVDVLGTTSDGRIVVDYGKFHDVE